MDSHTCGFARTCETLVWATKREKKEEKMISFLKPLLSIEDATLSFYTSLPTKKEMDMDSNGP